MRNGDRLSLPKRSNPDGPVCSFEPCGRDAYWGGLCEGHSGQKRRGNELQVLRQDRPFQKCSVPHCQFLIGRSGSFSLGLCNAHRQRHATGKDLNPPIKKNRAPSDRKCTYVFRDGTKCTRPHRSMSYCSPHYMRNLQGVDMDAPLKPFIPRRPQKRRSEEEAWLLLARAAKAYVNREVDQFKAECALKSAARAYADASLVAFEGDVDLGSVRDRLEKDSASPWDRPAAGNEF